VRAELGNPGHAHGQGPARSAGAAGPGPHRRPDRGRSLAAVDPSWPRLDLPPMTPAVLPHPKRPSAASAVPGARLSLERTPRGGSPHRGRPLEAGPPAIWPEHDGARRAQLLKSFGRRAAAARITDGRSTPVWSCQERQLRRRGGGSPPRQARGRHELPTARRSSPGQGGPSVAAWPAAIEPLLDLARVDCSRCRRGCGAGSRSARPANWRAGPSSGRRAGALTHLPPTERGPATASTASRRQAVIIAGCAIPPWRTARAVRAGVREALDAVLPRSLTARHGRGGTSSSPRALDAVPSQPGALLRHRGVPRAAGARPAAGWTALFDRVTAAAASITCVAVERAGDWTVVRISEPGDRRHARLRPAARTRPYLSPPRSPGR
jgi:hypothetical protein